MPSSRTSNRSLPRAAKLGVWNSEFGMRDTNSKFQIPHSQLRVSSSCSPLRCVSWEFQVRQAHFFVRARPDEAVIDAQLRGRLEAGRAGGRHQIVLLDAV